MLQQPKQQLLSCREELSQELTRGSRNSTRSRHYRRRQLRRSTEFTKHVSKTSVHVDKLSLGVINCPEFDVNKHVPLRTCSGFAIVLTYCPACDMKTFCYIYFFTSMRLMRLMHVRSFRKIFSTLKSEMVRFYVYLT